MFTWESAAHQLYDQLIAVKLIDKPRDDAQKTFEHGGAGMSAPEIGQKTANGDENTPKLPLVNPKMSSFEISTDNARVSGGCADLP
jgi:hypothetical protein